MRDTKDEERGHALINALAVVLESMVQSSESLALYKKSKFEAFRAPGISIRDYLARIHKFAACSSECFVLALVYIDRLHHMQGIVLTELNVHRIVITSIVLAAKFFDDHYYNNAYYAKVGGVPCCEMNELEVEYLLMINFTLHLSPESYTSYYNALLRPCAFSGQRHVPRCPTYERVRHYVASDPNRQGELVYVTEPLPKVLHRSQPPLYPLRTSKNVEENGKNTMATTPHSAWHFGRSTGHKRCSAVALGVNA